MSEDRHIEGWARIEERPLLRRLDEVAVRVHQRYAPEITDFLTPREQVLALSMGRFHQLNVTFWGGHAEAERKRALFAPDYWQSTNDNADFDITIVQGELSESGSVTHRDIMGSLLGTGIQRKKVGDIALSGKVVYVVLDQTISDFVLLHWHTAGRSEIHLEVVNEAVSWPTSSYQAVHGTVASLRLDAVLAQFCKWSRAKAQAAIAKGSVSLNFTPVTKTDEQLEEGDILSIRSFGRIKILSLNGESRRGKVRIEVGVLKS